MMILWILLACVLSAILYRCGGMSKDPSANPKWIPVWMRHGKARDVGCSLVFIGLSMLLFGVNSSWWGYLLAFGASWGALTTYWDWITGKDNFYLHGLGCGLAGLFLLMCGIPWYILVGRLIICSLGMGIWSASTGNDVKEEMRRGVFFII